MRFSDVMYGAGTVTLFPAATGRDNAIPDYRGMSEAQLLQAQKQIRERLGRFAAHRAGQVLVTALVGLGALGTFTLAVKGFPGGVIGLPYLSAMWFWTGCTVYRARRDRKGDL